MSKNEKQLSDYIDILNAEKKPKEHGNPSNSPELETLFKTVRLLRSLREPGLPAADYPEKLAGAVALKLPGSRSRKKKRSRLISAASAAAAILVVIAVFYFVLPVNKGGIVYAMEKAFDGIKAYHGTLEIDVINGDGQTTAESETEVWADKEGHYYTRQLEGSQKELITVNNGQRKWQVQPEQKQVNIFPAFPDPYRFTFELGKEVNEVKNALEYKIVGEETVSGRKASLLEVTPKGGTSYRLWLDKETGLPLQKESGMQNALQYRVTYTSMEFIGSIPAELTSYTLPAGYSENNTKPEQIVASLDEAAELAGFSPKIPSNIPEGYIEMNIAVETLTRTVKFNFISEDKSKRIVTLQSKSVNELKPASTAILGKVGSSIAEVQSPVQEGLGVLGGSPYEGVTGISSVRWQQEGMEYAVVGNDSLEVIAGFIKSISPGEVEIAAGDGISTDKPKVVVPYDWKAEENEQKSVDAGHSPWRLDPAFVAQVFVSLQISPEGINGDYPISQEELKVVKNTGNEAVIEVGGDVTPVAKVYLKRLVRQDSTGIWTVVGYDPVAK